MSTAEPRELPRPPQPVTVVVAHRRDDARAQLGRWLDADGRFAVVGEAADADAAVEAIVDRVPDIAFVDVDLPAGGGGGATDGVEAIATLTERRPGVRLVAVADEDDDHAFAALGAGAVGCYRWDDPVATAADVAAGAARGEGALTPGWATRILADLAGATESGGPVPAPRMGPTELEVLRRIASGASPAAIAQLHGVTEHLVNLHGAIAVTRMHRYADARRQAAATPPG